MRRCVDGARVLEVSEDPTNDLPKVMRLLEIVFCAELERNDSIGGIASSRMEKDRDVARPRIRFDIFQDVALCRIGKIEVEHDGVRSSLSSDIDCQSDLGERHCRQAGALCDSAEKAPHVAISSTIKALLRSHMAPGTPAPRVSSLDRSQTARPYDLRPIPRARRLANGEYCVSHDRHSA